MQPELILVGAGGHAAVVADAASLSGWHVVGYLDSTASGPDREHAGLPLWTGPDALERARRSHPRAHFIVAIGSCAARLSWTQRAVAAGLSLATVTHPFTAIATTARIGQGTFVAAGATVGPESKLGLATLVNTGASVDHHCRLFDGCHVAPRATLGGRVSVGERTWIGLGATVCDGVTIGERCLVGAGAVVVDDLPSDTLAFGVPARRVRAVTSQDLHLATATPTTHKHEAQP